MLEAEYKRLVMADYELKRQAKELHAEVLSPTPGRIKSEAAKVCYERFNIKDRIILNSFVDQKEGMAEYRAAFQTCDADIFRQVVRLMNEPTANTDIIYVNFLAWLINFQPRPFHPELKVQAGNNIQQPAANPAPVSVVAEPAQAYEEKSGTKKSSKKTWLYAALLLFILFVGFLFLYNPGKHYTGREGCMVWHNDHFEPIECGSDKNSATCYPINWRIVHNFQKILKPDTMTPYSVRKAYYAKHNGQVIFFTGNGPNVLDTDKRLLPMTQHILDKYVYHTAN